MYTLKGIYNECEKKAIKAIEFLDKGPCCKCLINVMCSRTCDEREHFKKISDIVLSISCLVAFITFLILIFLSCYFSFILWPMLCIMVGAFIISIIVENFKDEILIKLLFGLLFPLFILLLIFNLSLTFLYCIYKKY